MKNRNTAIKLFLFDLDGTLLNTLPNFANHLFTLLNTLPESVLKTDCYSAPALPDLQSLTDRVRAQVSHGSRAMIQACFQDQHTRSEHFLNHFYNQFLKQHRDNLTQHTVFFPGIQSVLNQLIESNIPWGIVTNKSTVTTELLSKHFTVLKYAVVQVCGDTLATSKPNPEPLWFACKQAGFLPDDTLFIGDSELDLQAGHAAKITTLFAAYGYGTCLPNHNLEHIIQTPQELFKWI